MLYITGFKSPTSSSYTIVLWQSGSFVYCSKSRFSWALKAHRNRLSHNLRKTVSWNDEHFIYIHSLPVGKCIYKSFGEWSICNTMQQVGTSWYSLSNLRGSIKEYYPQWIKIWNNKSAQSSRYYSYMLFTLCLSFTKQFLFYRR